MNSITDNPISELKQLTGRLSENFEGDPWYGNSVLSILGSVDPGFVFIAPGTGTHSIAELVAHMISWRAFAVHRLQGDDEFLPEQEETFDWKRFSARRANAWRVLLDHLKSNQKLLLDLARQNDDSLLERKVAGKSYTYRYLLQGILDHDLYHLGQIAYIHKMLQTTYNPKNSLFQYSFRVFPYEDLCSQK